MWFHSIRPPGWLTAQLVNSVFFFLSGIFSKRELFGQFMAHKAKQLLVSFIVFYLVCYPFRLFMHYWDFRTLEWFDWWCIFDLFEVHGINDYLALNIQLWFLLCLFVVQVMYYVISQLNRWV